MYNKSKMDHKDFIFSELEKIKQNILNTDEITTYLGYIETLRDIKIKVDEILMINFAENPTVHQKVIDEKIKNIQDMILQYHDPTLVQSNQSPNDNTIYHIYNDFSVTQQKGGYAYLQRNEILIEKPIYIKDLKSKLVFPCSSYAIMTLPNIYRVLKEVKLLKTFFVHL